MTGIGIEKQAQPMHMSSMHRLRLIICSSFVQFLRFYCVFLGTNIVSEKVLSLTVQKRKTSRISSVYAGFETFFIVNRYAYVAPSFWKNRMKGARARLSLIPGAEFSTRAYLSYKRLSYFFVCLHMFLIFAIGINSFEVSNPKAWCRESVSSLRL